MRLNGEPQRTKIERRFHAERGKPARAENFQSANYFGGGQAQIQRGDDHADFEAAIFQQNMIHGKRQQGDQKVALGEAHAQQFSRQRRRGSVELAPRDGAIALPWPISLLRYEEDGGRQRRFRNRRG